MANASESKKANLLIKLLSDVGTGLLQRRIIDDFEIHRSTDVHAFYRLNRNPERALHVTGYPGASTYKQAVVLARLLDYHQMMKLRGIGYSPGTEHDAVIERDITLRGATDISYDSRVLEEILAEKIPQLK